VGERAVIREKKMKETSYYNFTMLRGWSSSMKTKMLRYIFFFFVSFFLFLISPVLIFSKEGHGESACRVRKVDPGTKAKRGGYGKARISQPTTGR
jgi:hypothetical protein